MIHHQVLCQINNYSAHSLSGPLRPSLLGGIKHMPNWFTSST